MRYPIGDDPDGQSAPEPNDASVAAEVSVATGGHAPGSTDPTDTREATSTKVASTARVRTRDWARVMRL